MSDLRDEASFTRAIINILEDSNTERDRLQLTHKATLNILEDFEVAATDLRQANEEMAHLDRLKSEFVAMASHELRTPLTSITGFASTMLDNWQTTSEASKHEYVCIIDDQAQRLSRLVEDLLTISRIESGALKTNASTINVGAAIRQTIQDLDIEDVDVSCDTDVLVVADRDHLQQIMVNLLTNAIRHGKPPISVEVVPRDGSVQIHVIDHGPGVPEAFVPHLFERFAQADCDHSRSTADGKGKGTGLGLSIVDALVTAQGGTTWHAPVDPTGSRFTVRIPIAPSAP